MKRKRRAAVIAVVALVLTLLIVAAAHARHPAAAPGLVTGVVTRGPVVSTVAAIGTVEPVTTVEVGSQVSGTVASLGVDFNSIVKKGAVIARLEPSLARSAVDQARANVARAEADGQGMRTALADSETKLGRARTLAAEQLIAPADLDAAVVDEESAVAAVHSADAQAGQARAALREAEDSLAKTVIASPIDGIVVSRDVDVGQTVSANVSAPTLFVLAADMTRMQIDVSVDESDAGRVRAGEAATFTVDAFPNETFAGRVEALRLDPVVDSNVVSYTAIVSAPNPKLELKPGMTATVAIEALRHDDVLRVPAAALRFQPAAAMLTAFGQQISGRPPTGAPAPPAQTGATGTVWQLSGGTLQPVAVSTGATDGILTEISGTSLSEGARVVTRASLASE